MPRFEEDKHREEVLNEFLVEEFYPRVATSHEPVTSQSEQERGHDVRATFNWTDGPVVLDEKAQNSTYWLNDPSPTFVMEIFGESRHEDGSPTGDIGWFVDENNETEYYVLVWLPDVSLFRLEWGVDTDPTLVYSPPAAVSFTPDDVAAQSKSPIQDTMDDDEGEYRIKLTTAAADAFEAAVEPLASIITESDAADYGEWYYDPQHIHEAKVAIVAKDAVRETLAADGLTRDVLIQEGRRAIDEGRVDVASSKATSIQRAGGNQSGTTDDEDPVILVVTYETYEQIADATLHYKDGSWKRNVSLF